MGRIKSTAIKNLARELLEVQGNKFTTDFEKNKKVVGEMKHIQSKKVRNVVTGYITSEMEKAKKSEARA
jgi:small subunit ribosomal protein S17e